MVNLTQKQIAKLAEIRRIDDLHANGFGSMKVNQGNPACKVKAYKEHGLTFEEGEAITWGFILKEMEDE